MITLGIDPKNELKAVATFYPKQLINDRWYIMVRMNYNNGIETSAEYNDVKKVERLNRAYEEMPLVHFERFAEDLMREVRRDFANATPE